MSRLYIAYRPTIPSPPDPTASYEPETLEYMSAIAVPYNDTIYFASTAFERTGIQRWDAYNDFFLTMKTHHGLTLGVNNMSTIYDNMYTLDGGSSSYAKFNIVNPLDTDAAFRLSFSGGWSFTGGGGLPNGTNGYANTHWDSLTYGASNRISYGKYMRVHDTGGVHGTWDLNNNTRLYDQVNTAAGSYTIGNTSGIGAGTPRTRFHAVAVRAASTKVFSDSAIITNAGAISYTTIDKPFYIGARNNNSASVNQYTDGEIAFYYITGKVELSDADVLALNAAVDQLMLDLGRNV